MRDKILNRINKGKVSLIGAGPGDLELLTLRAVRLIGEADVLLLDDLVNPDIVGFAKPDVRVVYVGKRAGLKSITQATIHEEMISLAESGLTVARIKGGDPFVFGRGGEELVKLLEAGIDVTTVNGISAGLAAPAMLGIPLSHREYAHSITFITGHDTGDEQLNWRSLAQSGGTLVIFMGIRHVASIVRNLLANGMSPAMPAAAIQHATLPDQRSIICSVSELPDAIQQKEIVSPAILIIGKVVELSPVLEQFVTRMVQPVEIA
jgi:uroporphyrin-III C-methyltransferase